MGKKISKGQGNQTSRKMVPESEAMACLQDLCHKVVFGNEETRMILLRTINDLAEDDGKNADDIAGCIITMVYQDDEFREKFLDDLAYNDLAMEIYDAAMEIREILNLDALDLFHEKVRKCMEAEEECKKILYPKSNEDDDFGDVD